MNSKKIDHSISADELWALDAQRRKEELPWTAADEARLDAKRAVERAAQAAYEAAHAEQSVEDYDEDDDLP